MAKKKAAKKTVIKRPSESTSSRSSIARGRSTMPENLARRCSSFTRRRGTTRWMPQSAWASAFQS